MLLSQNALCHYRCAESRPMHGTSHPIGSGDIMQASGDPMDYQVIALSPWSVQEMYDLTLRALI